MADRERCPERNRLAGAEVNNPRIDVGEGAGGQGAAAIANGADHGRFAEFVVSRGAIPVNAGAAANHSLVVVERIPRESNGGLKLLGIVPGGTEIVGAGSQNRREVLRFGQVAVVKAGLRVPAQAVSDGEAGRDLPGVLHIGSILIEPTLGVITVRRGRGYG